MPLGLTVLSLPPDATEPDPTYRAALDWVWSFSARPRSVEEMAGQRAVKLERMHALLAGLGHPERRFRAVLVAGTKGKGSTVAMLGACLRKARHRTGVYTSPHLVNWRERTVLDGQPISTADVVRLVPRVRAAAEALSVDLGGPTTFEIGTALSFAYFAEHAPDIVVVEVGTGGRFDATNLVDPLVSVIAPISFDHMQTLGTTLPEIAWHKAGIMRPGRTCVSAPQVPEVVDVLEAEARHLGTTLERVGREWKWEPAGDDPTAIRVSGPASQHVDLQVNLLGDHQKDNATAAVAAVHALACRQPDLSVPEMAMRQGISHVDWPGRLQVLGRAPLVVVDGAHNGASALALAQAVRANFSFARLHLVLGLTAGKDVPAVVQALAPLVSAVYLTQSRHERSTPPAEIAPLVRERAPEASVHVTSDLSMAIEAALAAARPDDLVLVTGSLFLVGEMLVWWRRSPR